MQHRKSSKKFSRTSSHRKSMFINMFSSLVAFKSINTTLPKAKELSRFAQSMITIAKKGDNLHNRRILLSKLANKNEVVNGLFAMIDQFSNRQGGYIRVLKNGFRYGDNAPLAVLEFVGSDKM